jgi:hypothetical protein
VKPRYRIDGETMSVKQWAAAWGVPTYTAHYRIGRLIGSGEAERVYDRLPVTMDWRHGTQYR